MKIITVLGTRPEIIRLHLLIEKLDRVTDHRLVHTGQNFEPVLSDQFFTELELRQPDDHFELEAKTFGMQMGSMSVKLEAIFEREAPDRILILGDTNTALITAILAERMNIPVVHMEAGNRCRDRRVPEEVNRQLIDAIATFALPYTPQSRENLLREGIPANRIMVSGNPIYEVIEHHRPHWESNRVLPDLGLTPNRYLLATFHRAENVDNPTRLGSILEGLSRASAALDLPVICSIHPRTRQRINQFNLTAGNEMIQLHQPFSFFQFLKLEHEAHCVLTDSGTVQEECCLFMTPTVTIRDTTERPETIDCGSNLLSGLRPGDICRAAVWMSEHKTRDWNLPAGYADGDVSDRVAGFILGTGK